MYDKVFEQAAESFFKPISEIMALNVEAFDSLRSKNTDLVSEMVNESIEYARGLAKPNFDIETLVQSQQNFYEGLRTKLSDNAQFNYDLLADMQGKVTELWTGAWDASKQTVTAAAAAASPVKQAAKPKAEASAKTAPTPAKKAAPKATQRAEKPASEAPRKSVES